MDYIGSGNSSKKDKFNKTANFKNKFNTVHTINTLQSYQNKTTNFSETLTHAISMHNANPIITLNINFCTRPVNLLLDTGASISLVSKDVIKTNFEKGTSIKLYGINGKSTPIETNGFAIGQTTISTIEIPITLHIIDRIYAGPADGYLGFDFLSKYHSTINLENKTIVLKLNDLEYMNNNNGEKKENSTNMTECIEPYPCYNQLHFLETMYNLRYVTPTTINKNKKYIHYNNSAPYEICASNVYEIRTIPEGAETFEISSNTQRAEKILNEIKIKHCNTEEQARINDLCQRFSFQFYLQGDILSCTGVLKHKIELKHDAKPVYTKQYRIPQAHKNKLFEIINDYENQGLIERCFSPFNSPIILVEKKDDMGNKTDLRLVIDFRKLNEITVTESFPIPLIDEILEDMSGSRFFTLLDIKGAFHQIELEKHSRPYTAFTAGHIQYCWNRLPMGLTNAPITWQRVINIILTDLIGKNVHAYLDDIVIFARDEPKHDETLERVMKLIKENNLQLKISKCMFYAKKFEYLGHIVSKDGISPNPRKIDAIKKFPSLTNLKMVQSFLGLCSYYRRYIRDFAKITKPLTALCRTKTPFNWNIDAQKAFEHLKISMTDEVVLPFPDFEKQFYCTTDASDVALGGVLSQGDPPNDRPIQFYSRTLTDTETRYSTIQKELLAIIESIRAFRPYLYGRSFILITDHKPLVHLFSLKNCSSILYRMKLTLMEYDFKVMYRAGSQNTVADCLSRTKIPNTLTADIHSSNTLDYTKQDNTKYERMINETRNIVFNPKKYDALYYLITQLDGVLHSKLTSKFENLRIGKNWLEIDSKFYIKSLVTRKSIKLNPQKINEAIGFILSNTIKNQHTAIIIHTDIADIMNYEILKRTLQNNFANTASTIHLSLCNSMKIYDNEERIKIMNTYHKSMLGGHTGIEKMLKTIKQFYQWDNMAEDIEKFVKNCDVCEKTKYTTHIKAPMEISSLGDALFDHTFIDFVGPLGETIRNNKYIFTACCDLTKFLVCVPTMDCSAKTTAISLMNNVFLRYNFPNKLISDNASNFTSKLITEINKLLKIAKIYTLPYKPQANIVERNHRTLNAYLRAFTSEKDAEWDDKLPYFTFAYNNAIHSTTGLTPHELAHGFKIKIPNSLLSDTTPYTYSEYAKDIKQNIKDAYKLATEYLMTTKHKNKILYDKKTSDDNLLPGDLVLMKKYVKNNKFDNIYDGPFRIHKVRDGTVTIIKGNKYIKVHKNFLKKSIAEHDKEPPHPFPVVEMSEDELAEIMMNKN